MNIYTIQLYSINDLEKYTNLLSSFTFRGYIITEHFCIDAYDTFTLFHNCPMQPFQLHIDDCPAKDQAALKEYLSESGLLD